MKHLFSILTVVFAVLAFLVSCGGSESGNSGPGIFGYVTDENGEPIASATVQLDPSKETALTGADGYFEFINLTPSVLEPSKEGIAYEASYYRINVSKNGYESYHSGDITVKDKMLRFDVQLKEYQPDGGY